MRKATLFVTIVVLGMCAHAQELIDFTNLPDTSSPNSIPENYAGLHWGAIDVVDPLEWADAGAGFFSGNEAMLAFGGGPLCFPDYGGVNNDGTPPPNICESTISAGVGPTAMTSFQADSAVVASGWINGSITVTAYKNGRQVGAPQRYNLTTTASRIVFPSSWGQITQLVIHPSPRGSFVIYTLQMN